MLGQEWNAQDRYDALHFNGLVDPLFVLEILRKVITYSEGISTADDLCCHPFTWRHIDFGEAMTQVPKALFDVQITVFWIELRQIGDVAGKKFVRTLKQTLNKLMPVLKLCKLTSARIQGAEFVRVLPEGSNLLGNVDEGASDCLSIDAIISDLLDLFHECTERDATFSKGLQGLVNWNDFAVSSRAGRLVSAISMIH